MKFDNFNVLISIDDMLFNTVDKDITDFPNAEKCIESLMNKLSEIDSLSDNALLSSYLNKLSFEMDAFHWRSYDEKNKLYFIYRIAPVFFGDKLFFIMALDDYNYEYLVEELKINLQIVKQIRTIIIDDSSPLSRAAQNSLLRALIGLTNELNEETFFIPVVKIFDFDKEVDSLLSDECTNFPNECTNLFSIEDVYMKQNKLMDGSKFMFYIDYGLAGWNRKKKKWEKEFHLYNIEFIGDTAPFSLNYSYPYISEKMSEIVITTNEDKCKIYLGYRDYPCLLTHFLRAKECFVDNMLLNMLEKVEFQMSFLNDKWKITNKKLSLQLLKVENYEQANKFMDTVKARDVFYKLKES